MSCSGLRFGKCVIYLHAMIQPWFSEAKLGIFIHWGIYAIQGRGGESWPLIRGEVSMEEYHKQIEAFTAKNYDPSSWAKLIRRAGARYGVLTTKHHDGVSLWPTAEDGPSIPNHGKTGDLVGPFVEALRAENLHPGLYFSHTDWAHPDHFQCITGLSATELAQLRNTKHDYIKDWQRVANGLKPAANYQEAWEKFLQFRRNQIRELLTSYGPIDLLWFDVMIGLGIHDYESKKLRDFIHQLSPQTVVNSRLEEYGDYETPEQFIPVYAPEGPWEFCVTTNNTWSYTGREQGYKTPFELITMFSECLGMGGNMLLNIGPDESGVVPPQQVELLEALGDWIARHEEAVYPTRRGLPHGYAYGPTSLNASGDTIYLYLSHLPREKTFIKGIHNDIKTVSVLGASVPCTHERVGGAPWLNVPGTLAIDIPQGDCDPLVTVLKIELNGELDLYSGEGVEIDIN